MNMSVSPEQLTAFIDVQLTTFFPDGRISRLYSSYINEALERSEYCFSKINNQYFTPNGEPYFDHLHGDQYAMFLYLLANTIYRKEGDLILCKKIFHLNRYLHGIDAFYKIDLPDIFVFVHPLGTVLGRAVYDDYFTVYQRCSIGSNHGDYPRLGKYVSLHPGAGVLGNCLIGENCKISAGSLLIDKDLPNQSIFIGDSIQYTIKSSPDRLKIWKD